MRIAIINITGGGMSGGYRKYLQNVIPRMAAHHAVEAILCASPESTNLQDWLKSISNVRPVSCKPFRFLFAHHNTELLRALERFSADVIFVPVERAFCFKNVPVVNLLQNMEPFVSNIDGNFFVEGLRHLGQRADAKRATKGAARVIAISRFVSDFFVKRWEIPKEKIGLVYHGVDNKSAKDGSKPNIIPDSRNDKFIFTAGSIRPARGLEDILCAMKYLGSQGMDGSKLVIAGSAAPQMVCYQKKIKNWIEIHSLSSKVCWTGGLNEKEMVWCYQNCGLFIMTSRVEACPNMALEAMSHGCICIAADNPPLPEIFGDAAIFYPPKDGEALAGVIKTVFGWDDNQQKAMSKKAKKRAADFSWDICAEKTIEVLASVMSNSKMNRDNANE